MKAKFLAHRQASIITHFKKFPLTSTALQTSNQHTINAPRAVVLRVLGVALLVLANVIARRAHHHLDDGEGHGGKAQRAVPLGGVCPHFVVGDEDVDEADQGETQGQELGEKKKT